MDFISTSFTGGDAESKKPFRLLRNASVAFNGTKIYGAGFVITPEAAAELISESSRNRDVLFPYLNGDDFNSTPTHSPTRWVINFTGYSLEQAGRYRKCLEIVQAKVKPYRDGLGVASTRDNWWLYERAREELYAAVATCDSAVVGVRHTKYWSVARCPKDWVFSDAVVVFAVNGHSRLAVLQSSFHQAWAWEYSGSLKRDLRYSPSDCFENFAFPPETQSTAISGKAFHDAREAVQQHGSLGLTDLYNRFHDPEVDAAEIQKLRDLHVEMDKAVAAAYGWDTLDLGHGFHETKQGVRFTISDSARREVLQRLLKLNHERYAEEVKQGLHDKKKSAAKKPKAAKAPAKPKASKNLSLGFDTEGDDE